MTESGNGGIGPAGTAFCNRCGSALPADALYCPRRGAKVAAGTAPAPETPPAAGAHAAQAHDHFGLGLLLIKVGVIVSFVMPLLLIAGFSTIGFPFFPGGPTGGVFTGVVSSIVILGFVFGVVTAFFYRDISAGNSRRIVHTIVLAALMFVLGSNIAGILVGAGAFLCYSSPRSSNRYAAQARRAPLLQGSKKKSRQA